VYDAAVPLALRYRGHRCSLESAIVPWYFRGSLDLTGGEEFPIPPAGLMLGRGTLADVRVASNGVARRHVRVSWDGHGSLIAEDLGSTNGTQVNGVGLAPPGVVGAPQRLRPGDILTLAGVFDFEVVEIT
jgi:hypothetical protein